MWNDMSARGEVSCVGALSYMVPPNDSVDLVLRGGAWLRDTNQQVDCLGVCSDRSQLGFEGWVAPHGQLTSQPRECSDSVT